MGTSTQSVRLRVVSGDVPCSGVTIPPGEYEGHIDWVIPDGGGLIYNTSVQLIAAGVPGLANTPCEVLRYLDAGHVQIIDATGQVLTATTPSGAALDQAETPLPVRAAAEDQPPEITPAPSRVSVDSGLPFEADQIARHDRRRRLPSIGCHSRTRHHFSGALGTQRRQR